MFVVCNYRNIKSLYIFAVMHVCVYMHMTVYICIVCARLRVCVSKHYTMAYVSSATLFELLRGPSVHVGLEAKKSVHLLPVGDGAEVRAPRLVGRILQRLSHHDYAEIRSGRFRFFPFPSCLRCSLHLCC